MALATKCPHCNTIFRVAADQLKLRGGIVRCGSCHQVFDGNSALVEPAAKPTPVIPDVVAERAAPAHTTPAISAYVHGTPVDFELDFAEEPAPAPAPVPAAPAPTAAKPAEATPPAARKAEPQFAPKPAAVAPTSATAMPPAARTAEQQPAPKPANTTPPADVPAPAVWRTSAAQAPVAAQAPIAEPSPDDAARAAVARAFATATKPPAAPQPVPPRAAEPPPPAQPPAPHPLAALVSPDRAFSEAAGEPPATGPWTPSVPPPAASAAPSAAAPSTTIDEKLLVWEDIPANASAASDAAAMAAVARAFNNVKNLADEKKAPAVAQEFVLDPSEPALAFKAPPVGAAPPSVGDVPSASAGLPVANDLPATDVLPAAEVLPTADALPTADEQPVAEEPLVAKELPGTDVLPAAFELPVVDELPATEQLPPAFELPAAGEPPVVEELPPVVELPVVDELPAADEPPTAGEPPVADELNASEEPPAAEELSVTVASSAVDDLPPADELPAASDTATTAPEHVQEEPAPEVEAPAIEAEEEPSPPAGAALIEAIDQWSANNAPPDGRIEPSFDIPQEHIVLAAIDDAHHFEDLPPEEQPLEEPFSTEANVEAEASVAFGPAPATGADNEPSLAEEPWPAAEDAADALSPTGEPWSLSEPEPDRDDTALHAVAAVNTDAPDDGESLPSDEEQAAAEAALAAARMRALAGVDEADDLDHSALSFVKRVDRSQKYGKAASIAMAIGIPVLLAGLALQAGTTFRDTLAANYPQLKPALAAMCQPLGCKIALPTQLDALSIEQGELATMAESTFSFSTVLRNQSKTAQAWPHIELTLNDNADKPVLRRVFAPREYLPSPAEAEKGFGPRSEQSIKLYFELKELKASGYHIAIFYP